MPHSPTYQRYSDAVVNAVFLKFIPVWVSPNVVSTLRLIITPFVYTAVVRESYLSAIALFLVASLTDLVDGAMARTRNQITRSGKMLDPIADKVLIGSLMIPLVARFLSLKLAITILVIEGVILCAGLYRISVRQVEVQANWWGKVKFTFQVFATLALLASITATIPQLASLATIFYVLAIVFAVCSLATEGF